MRNAGVLAVDHISVGLVVDGRLSGAVQTFPDSEETDSLRELPAEAIAECIRWQVELAAGGPVDVVGVGVPGIIRDGVIEDAPNLAQLKGLNLRTALEAIMPSSRVVVVNDADAIAAGIASTRGELGRLVRVWTLGIGVGYGRYPRSEGVWEGGHSVVTLDPKEQYCGCGGAGHLEGIMGHRAMRLRFLDLEPEEIFDEAREGDERCRQFVKMWHRALAAATATSIHLDGPGRFYITGANARHIDSLLLNLYLHEMVKLSSLQGSFCEVMPTSDEIAVLGAAVCAEG
ncbi:MAG: ROK family protein [Bryobacteraceae bacterium]